MDLMQTVGAPGEHTAPSSCSNALVDHQILAVNQ